MGLGNPTEEPPPEQDQAQDKPGVLDTGNKKEEATKGCKRQREGPKTHVDPESQEPGGHIKRDRRAIEGNKQAQSPMANEFRKGTKRPRTIEPGQTRLTLGSHGLMIDRNPGCVNPLAQECMEEPETTAVDGSQEQEHLAERENPKRGERAGRDPVPSKGSP